MRYEYFVSGRTPTEVFNSYVWLNRKIEDKDGVDAVRDLLIKGQNIIKPVITNFILLREIEDE